MIGLFGRQGPAATLWQLCPQMTQRRCTPEENILMEVLYYSVQGRQKSTVSKIPQCLDSVHPDEFVKMSAKSSSAREYGRATESDQPMPDNSDKSCRCWPIKTDSGSDGRRSEWSMKQRWHSTTKDTLLETRIARTGGNTPHP